CCKPSPGAFVRCDNTSPLKAMLITPSRTAASRKVGLSPPNQVRFTSEILPIDRTATNFNRYTPCIPGPTRMSADHDNAYFAPTASVPPAFMLKAQLRLA